MNIRLGPLTVSFTWNRPRPEPTPAEVKTSLVSEMLDLAAHLHPVAVELMTMDLPPDSRTYLEVVVYPHYLLACRPDDALQALRHVAYLAVESGLAHFSDDPNRS